ncbi:hypothetical protein N2152v2_005049 [Parachlorella kessleri]
MGERSLTPLYYAKDVAVQQLTSSGLASNIQAVQQRLQGGAIAVECDSFSNNYTDSFSSVVTRSLSWRFYCLALKAGTDKVSGGTDTPNLDHQYQLLYSRYFGHLRDEPIKLLEIGLGCNMAYGPGKSLELWRKLFPRATISFIESDVECAEKYKQSVEREAGGTLYMGDQKDAKLLAKIVADAHQAGQYDIIIDDGGHNPTVQLVSLQGLWPALKSGGAYVEEDVHPTYFRGDTFQGFYNATGPTFMGWGVASSDECDSFVNNYTSAFSSAVTRSLGWRFYCLALKAGTDKVSGSNARKSAHQYQVLYAKYFGHLRDEPIKLLEIGLGCNMFYGPGKSLELWRKLFPKAQISFVEYDVTCAKKYKESIERESGGTLYMGDQKDAKLLAKIVADARQQGQYDIIIDDGGHNPTVQLVSLQGLWPALKSGGAYVEEDVHPTYFRPDVGHGFYNATGPTFMSLASRLVDLVHCSSGVRDLYCHEAQERCKRATPLEQSVLAVDCMPEACVLVKK